MSLTLADIATKLPVLRVECNRCGRAGRYHTAKLIERFGPDATVEPLQKEITQDCPRRDWDRTKHIGTGCAPLFPDLTTVYWGLKPRE
ncbi:MAG TPA: hypothetical protein VG328_17945 [Stellaceae bacterium]|jgi:hypothetical protein|nr:hypothetical protein [Stellaceae bacterium]